MIYVVEDNEGIIETIRSYLELEGYSVQEFSKTSGVIEAIDFKKPKLIILDVMLPDGNGFTLAKKIREKHPDIPFLFLSARDQESDRIIGLELGAEDYIVKPFSPRELTLRVKNILKRFSTTSGETTADVSIWTRENHRLEIQKKAHKIIIDSIEIHLTVVEWNILMYLCENDGVLISRERILGECLHYLHDGSEKTVNTHMKNLRAKLGSIEWIETVRGFGYRFSAKKDTSEKVQ